MSSSPYDIKITIDPDGTPTEIGLMLVHPPKEGKQYVITEVDPPEKHLDWIQTDFRGGMSGQKPQPSGTDQYWVGINFLADPASGHLFSGPDFEEASTVGTRNLTVFGGCVHKDDSGDHYGYMINNNDLYKSNTAGTTFASTKDPGAVIPLSVASWGDYVLLAIQGTEGYWYTPDEGANWTQSTLATGKYQDYFVSAGDILWGLNDPDELRWSTDPSNSGEWSGVTYVGEDTNDQFLRGFFIAQMLIIVKTSGIYSVDDGGNVERIVTVKNIRGACSDYTSKIYFYDAQDTIWEYDLWQGILRDLNLSAAVYLNPVIAGGNLGGGISWAAGKVFVSPSKVIYQWTQFRDQRGRLISEAWESLYNDTAGLQATRGAGWGGVVWAAHELLVGTRVSYPVYFGGSATATAMGYVRARAEADLNDAANLTYTIVDSAIYSGIIDHDKPTTRKMYQYLTVDLGGDDLNVQMAFSIDGATSLTPVGSAITTTGKTVIDFPAGTDGNFAVIRLTNDPSDNADYCELKSWGIHATVQPHHRRLIKMAVRIADGVTDRLGGRHSQRGDTLRTNLYSARTSGAKVQLEDYLGNTFNITILPPFTEVPSRDEKKSATECEIQFQAIEAGAGTET